MYRDYSRERGVLLMSGKTWRRVLGGKGVSSMGLYLHRQADAALLLSEVRARAGPSCISVRPSAELRALSLAVQERARRCKTPRRKPQGTRYSVFEV